VPEMTLGKRCVRLDLRQASDRDQFRQLVSTCDVLIHGYRADALERLGFGPDELESLRPGLVDVALNAYGWSGPWCTRRGFDSLVQMSSGIAAEGKRVTGRAQPVSLPVQALDYGTGYLLAAAALRGLSVRERTGNGWRAQASLARTAELLMSHGQCEIEDSLAPETSADMTDTLEQTAWGPARRLRPPLAVDGLHMRWDVPAGQLGTSPATWD